MKRTWMLWGCVVLATIAMAQEAARLKPETLAQLVEAERAFARMCVEKGFVASFYEFFAEDGIAFQPHPVKFREAVRKETSATPPPPRQLKLDWWPASGDVAESGELGYSTGPTITTNIAENRPVRYGFYTSVWKKQADGEWRVLVDLGVTLPGADQRTRDRMQYVRAVQEKYKKIKPGDSAARRSEMLKLETEFGKAAERNALDAYRKYMSSSCRIHRNLQFPLLGRDVALKHLENRKLSIKQWEALDGGIADSGELGYSYGRYEFQLTEGGQQKTEKGYFLRLWKRDAKGEWKLVAEVARALSERG